MWSTGVCKKSKFVRCYTESNLGNLHTCREQWYRSHPWLVVFPSVTSHWKLFCKMCPESHLQFKKKKNCVCGSKEWNVLLECIANSSQCNFSFLSHFVLCRYEPFFRKEFPCPECRLDVNPKYRHLLWSTLRCQPWKGRVCAIFNLKFELCYVRQESKVSAVISKILSDLKRNYPLQKWVVHEVKEIEIKKLRITKFVLKGSLRFFLFFF